MTELTKEQLAELRKGKGNYLGSAIWCIRRDILDDLLDAVESRLAMLAALSADRAEEWAKLLTASLLPTKGQYDLAETLRTYALAARGEKGAGHGYITGTADMDALNGQAFKDDGECPTCLGNGTLEPSVKDPLPCGTCGGSGRIK